MTDVFGGYGAQTGKANDYATKAELRQKASRASGAKFGNVATLTSDGDLADSGMSAAALATRKYANTNDALRVLKRGDSMSGELDMRGGRVTNLGRPEHELDAANRHFVAQRDQDTLNMCLRLFLPLDGSVKARGDISFGGHSLREVGYPADPSDAATKEYVDDAAKYIALAMGAKSLARDGSNPPTRDISMAGHRLTSLAPPAHPTDAATRKYVDDLRSPRFHFKLGMQLVGGGGLKLGQFAIPNTAQRFGRDREKLAIHLTPVGSPLPSCIYGSRLDENYLMLAVGVDVQETAPPNIVFHAIVEVARAESISASPH